MKLATKDTKILHRSKIKIYIFVVVSPYPTDYEIYHSYVILMFVFVVLDAVSFLLVWLKFNC